MRTITALRQLGFTLSLDRGKVRYRFTGRRQPEGSQVQTLLAELKANRREAIECLQKETADLFLKSFRQALAELSRRYQPGTLNWIESHHPDLYQQIERTEDELDHRWREANYSLFEESLKGWQELHEQAIAAYSQPEVCDLVVLLQSGKARDLPPLKISQAETVTDAETFLRSYLRDLAHRRLGYLAYKQLQAFHKALKEEEN